jgi:small GTP-binding protein
MHYDSISIEEEYYDLKIRLMLIGDSNVGKTSIIKRYCNNQFSPSYISTVGIDFETKYLRLNGKIINLQIWDTAGQERYKVLAKNYYKNSDGFIIVYDITDKKSFNNVANWITQIKDSASENVKCVLLGNKCDLEELRQVDINQGKDLANNYHLKFYETSAQKGNNIQKVFTDLVKGFLNDDNFVNDSERSSISTEQRNLRRARNQKKKCC